MATESEDLAKLLAANPELIKVLQQVAKDPNKLSMLKSGPELTAPTLHDFVYAGITVCAVCGKRQEVWTLKKQGQVTQHVCSVCQNKLAMLSPEEQQKAMAAAMKKDYLGQAEAIFKVQQKHFVHMQKKAKEAAGGDFQVTRKPKGKQNDETED